MIPRHKAAKVSKSKAFKYPIRRQLCQCARCSTESSWDPVAQRPVKGCYLAKDVYALHQSYLEEHDVQAEPPSELGVPPPGDDSTELAPSDDAQTCEHLRRLHSFQTRLASSPMTVLDNILAQSPPVFAKPSSRGEYRLDETAKENEEIIFQRTWLLEVQSYVLDAQLLAYPLSTHVRLLGKTVDRLVQQELTAYDDIMRKYWASANVPEDDHTLNTSVYFSRPYLLMQPISLFSHLFVVILYLLAGVSQRVSNFSLSGIRELLKFSPSDSRSLDIPSEVTTVIKGLDLKHPSTKTYVCCPKCYALYDSSSPPEFCQSRPTPQSSICGKRLMTAHHRGIRNTRAPSRQFIYNDLKHWIGWMLSRPDLAQILDRDPVRYGGDAMHDIWDGEILCNFLGPDGQPWTCRGEEIRLLFSLNMDTFNPFGNRAAKKVVQTGAIYMALLNLPPNLRHRVENIYLAGVIPGPEAPRLDQINHLLRPLIDDLQILWQPGIWLTRTSTRPTGCKVRGAVVPVVSDLPATFELAGFGDHRSSHPCHECHIKLRDLDNIDKHSFVPRDKGRHLQDAIHWKEAIDEDLREALYKKTHIRWSALLDLPYWDPARFITIDSMHCFHLGLLQRHCRQVWGMNTTIPDGPGPTFDSKNLPSSDRMQVAWESLINGTDADLKKCRVGELSQLCRELGLRYSHRRTAQYLLDDLLHWRAENRHVAASTSHGSPHPIAPTAVNEPNISSNPQSATSPISKMDDELRELYTTATLTTVSRLKKATLFALVHSRLFHSLETAAAKATLEEDLLYNVASLKDLLQTARRNDGIIDERGKVIEKPQLQIVDDPSQSRAPPTKSCVLGSTTLMEVRRDMAQSIFPSWISPGPKHPGEARWGKLKADEWKVFCTIHLPVTLLRLWGGDPKKLPILDNFMHLVAAIQVVSLREIKEKDILDYEFHMDAYLSSLLKLYPGTHIVPNQHNALHFGDHLRRWGPTHAWRCYAFERFNGLLQSIKTNCNFGQLETTMFNKFTVAQSLRALLVNVSGHLPTHVEPLIREFEKRFRVDIRGTYLQDIHTSPAGLDNTIFEATPWLNGKPSPASVDMLAGLETIGVHLPDAMIIVQSSLRRHGQVYQASRRSRGNSQVIFSHLGETCAGFIREIVAHDDGSKPRLFLLVDRLEPLKESDQQFDHARRFPQFHGQAYYTHTNPLVISTHSILGHFVSVSGYRLEGVCEDLLFVLALNF
ncbi:hypothetical protein ONZ45_g4631 [Pleurotus djamor]|nr:hypothetical protein ONZ45_g4631 [Pleurotus djamor]